MVKCGNDFFGAFYFLVDKVRYAYLREYDGGSDYSPAGSATINIQLMAGQVVGIENVASRAIYGTNSAGNISSWFTGHLLYALLMYYLSNDQ